MADPTPEEERAARRKELADAFADGLDIYETRRAEREAKAKAEGDGKGDNGDGDTTPKSRSWAERLLG